MKGWVLSLAMLASMAGAQGAAWRPEPWLADLAAMRVAFEAKYANLDWLERERGLVLDQAFDIAAVEVRRAGSDAAARALFDRMMMQIGDGHVGLRWPVTDAASMVVGPKAYSSPAALCAGLGYKAGARPGVAAALPGVAPLPEPGDYAAATVRVGAEVVGIVRIPAFMPQAFPARCEAEVRARPDLLGKPCDAACEDSVLTASYQALTRGLQGTYQRLRAAGATVLLLDISDNGGGSEWAEAVARTLSPRPMPAARTGFIRGVHWASQWADLRDRLRGFARQVRGADRARLLAWAAEAERGRREAELPPAPGRARVVRLGHATGLVAEDAAGALSDKPWGPYLFSAGQPAYGFRRGAWYGPVIVLTNQRTYSAAEQIAALLQDNKVAVVLGERTGGSGCGHTGGGTPTTLPNSRAVLTLPDCVRFRADGSNEVNGIVPDIATGQRGNDGPAFAAGLVAKHLPAAVRAAQALWSAR